MGRSSYMELVERLEAFAYMEGCLLREADFETVSKSAEAIRELLSLVASMEGSIRSAKACLLPFQLEERDIGEDDRLILEFLRNGEGRQFGEVFVGTDIMNVRRCLYDLQAALQKAREATGEGNA